MFAAGPAAGVRAGGVDPNWVCSEHPAARIVVDANQAWTLDLLKQLLPKLAQLGVEMVEQPLACGADALLDGFKGELPLAADESCTGRVSLAELVGRYQFINIKLDKCDGLTEALAMAPAFLVAQACQYVDLDGPLLQKLDRACPMVYQDGIIAPPLPELWG